MSHKIQFSRILFASITLLAAISLSSCANSAYSKTLDEDQHQVEVIPVEEWQSEIERAETEPVEESLDFVTHEQARDIAVATLVEKFQLDPPQEWTAADKTPEGLLGASGFLYTSGAWVAIVKAPVVAPEYLVYSIEIVHICSGLRWEGEVDAAGILTEKKFSGPLAVLSVEDARDAAAAYIMETYGWSSPEVWVAQSPEPIENAGVQQIFTAGPWVIQVEFLAAAPIVPEYTITADHLNLSARWTGTIQADSTVIEAEYIAE